MMSIRLNKIIDNKVLLKESVSHYSKKLCNLKTDEDLESTISDFLKDVLDERVIFLKKCEELLSQDDINMNNLNDAWGKYGPYIIKAVESYRNDLEESMVIIRKKLQTSTPNLDDVKIKIDKLNQAWKDIQ